MESVNVPSETVPPEMKACEQILKRARELRKPEPVVAYWACFSAAQKALKVPNRSPEGTKWLMSLLDALEQMKDLIGNNEAVTNEAAGAAYVENFALKVFMSADNDDRNGNTGKGTIRRFVVAGQFIEILHCFENGMTEEMQQKLQYARWKAADGAKALREGRVPTSGPPIPEVEEDPFPSIPSDDPMGSSPSQGQSGFPGVPKTSGHSGSPARSITPTNSSPPTTARPNLPTIDTDSARTPQRTHSSTSMAWSTVATPGLPDAEEGERRFNLSGPSNEPSNQSGTPTMPRSPAGGDRKNVRFMGPDGAPLSPAQTHFSVDSYDAPAPPPPSTFSPSPTKDKPTQSFSRPRTDSSSSARPSQPVHPQTGNSRARTDSSATLHGTSNQAPTQGQSRPRADSASRTNPSQGNNQMPPPPPPSLASYPSAPPPQPASNGLGLTSPPPSAPPAQAFAAPPLGPTPTPTRKQVEQIQKHAKWAISALDFDDYETARSELRKALGMLGG